LTRGLLTRITDGEMTPKSVRPMGAEQSNTSLVYDSRYVLKMFRRLHEGRNPDLEVTQKLTEVDFPNVASVVATWQRDNYDLAVCQPFLWDGTEGWKLALGSARDFIGSDAQEPDPSSAGGDFGAEAGRLGAVTAEMHVALAEVFPNEPFDPERLASSLESSLGGVEAQRRPALERLIADIRSVSPGDAGMAIRVHGDYHLGQTLRSVSGWYIFDFEGEPARPLDERTKPASGLKDVTGMLRSFHYAAATALHEQMPSDRSNLQGVANAWEQRNRDAFREGYFSAPGVEKVLPSSADALDVLMRGFEVEKAIYELAYEKAYRPDWVSIPQSALERLLG
jgi:maltokinase